MNTYTKLKPLGKIAAVTASTLAFTSLINCGGGGAATDNLTIRPRTLEKLVINYQSAVEYEFIRSATSGKATDNGDIETGSVLYNRIRLEQDHKTSSGTTLTVYEPTTVGNITYTYQAINDISGRLTLNFTDAAYTDGDWGGLAPTGRDFTRNFTINFGGGTTSLASSTVSLKSFFTIVVVSTTLVDGVVVDTDFIYADSVADEIAVADGLNVAEFTLLGTMQTKTDSGNIASAGYDYDPDFEKRQSKVAPTSLNNYIYTFVDGDDTNDNFSLDFTKGAGNSSGFDEIGTAVFKDSDDNITVGSAGYTYKRIGGTDSAQIVLSGGTAQDGTMTVIFESGDTANQNPSGTYTTANGNTGTFSAPSKD